MTTLHPDVLDTDGQEDIVGGESVNTEGFTGKKSMRLKYYILTYLKLGTTEICDNGKEAGILSF